jgi:hypothetical protein
MGLHKLKQHKMNILTGEILNNNNARPNIVPEDISLLEKNNKFKKQDGAPVSKDA